MDQCQLVELDIVGDKSEHIVDGTIKYLVLAEITAQRAKNKVYQSCNIFSVKSVMAVTRKSDSLKYVIARAIDSTSYGR